MKACPRNKILKFQLGVWPEVYYVQFKILNKINYQMKQVANFIP